MNYQRLLLISYDETPLHLISKPKLVKTIAVQIGVQIGFSRSISGLLWSIPKELQLYCYPLLDFQGVLGWNPLEFRFLQVFKHYLHRIPLIFDWLKHVLIEFHGKLILENLLWFQWQKKMFRKGYYNIEYSLTESYQALEKRYLMSLFLVLSN